VSTSTGVGEQGPIWAQRAQIWAPIFFYFKNPILGVGWEQPIQKIIYFFILRIVSAGLTDIKNDFTFCSSVDITPKKSKPFRKDNKFTKFLLSN
jgi:hypothetical protein